MTKETASTRGKTKKRDEFAGQLDILRDKLERAPKMQMQVTGNKAVNLWLEGDEGTQMAKFMASIGTDDAGFVSDFLGHLMNGTNDDRKQADPKRFEFAQAVVQGIEPRDQVEAMLASQIAAIQVCTMHASRRYLLAEYSQVRDNAERSLNRLARTFTTQMETLQKYRNAGKQTVRVERVTINEGGQAIVGDVHHGGEVGNKNDR